MNDHQHQADRERGATVESPSVMSPEEVAERYRAEFNALADRILALAEAWAKEAAGLIDGAPGVTQTVRARALAQAATALHAALTTPLLPVSTVEGVDGK